MENADLYREKKWKQKTITVLHSKCKTRNSEKQSCSLKVVSVKIDFWLRIAISRAKIKIS